VLDYRIFTLCTTDSAPVVHRWVPVNNGSFWSIRPIQYLVNGVYDGPVAGGGPVDRRQSVRYRYRTVNITKELGRYIPSLVQYPSGYPRQMYSLVGYTQHAECRTSAVPPTGPSDQRMCSPAVGPDFGGGPSVRGSGGFS